MVTITPGVIWCPYSLIVYGAAPLLSIVFSAILMICDFIVPCVINKKVSNRCRANHIDNYKSRTHVVCSTCMLCGSLYIMPLYFTI